MEIPQATHYCVGCKKKKTMESWIFRSKKVGKKTIYWCGNCLDCVGCGKIHKNDTGAERITNEGHFCGKWMRGSSKSFEQRIQSMSSEEVVSGVAFGNPNQFSGVSEDYTPQVHQSNKRKALEALS